MSDPLTGGPGWHFGVGLLAEYAYEEMKTSDNSSIKDKDETFYPLWGARLMAGYGDFMISADYRRGEKSFDFTSQVGTSSVNYEADVDTWELEILARYFFSNIGDAPDRIVPYAAGGILLINDDQEFSIPGSTSTFTTTGTSKMRQELDVTSLMAGGGVIVPMGKSWGLRAEGLLMYASVNAERFDTVTSWSTRSGTGIGFQGTGTVYWSITDQLGLDLGLYYRFMEIQEDLGRIGKAGLKSSLTFTF